MARSGTRPREGAGVYRGLVPALRRPPAGTPGWGSPRRWGVFAVGYLCLMSGIALSITAGLGVGSWQVLETGLMALTGASFAVVALLESALCLVVAWVWLRQPPWLATVLLGAAGVGIGVLLELLSAPASLAGRVLMLAASMPLLASGIAFYLASDLGASAQDAIFVGIYRRYVLRPGRLRFAMDGALVLAGLLIGGQLGAGTLAITVVVPLLLEPALRIGHRLADTPLPAALVVATQPTAADVVIALDDQAGAAPSARS